MSQQSSQRSPSRPWVIIGLVLVAVIAALLIAFCPKPKPVPASTELPTPKVTAPDAPKQEDRKQ